MPMVHANASYISYPPLWLLNVEAIVYVLWKCKLQKLLTWKLLIFIFSAFLCRNPLKKPCDPTGSYFCIITKFAMNDFGLPHCLSKIKFSSDFRKKLFALVTNCCSTEFHTRVPGKIFKNWFGNRELKSTRFETSIPTELNIINNTGIYDNERSEDSSSFCFEINISVQAACRGSRKIRRHYFSHRKTISHDSAVTLPISLSSFGGVHLEIKWEEIYFIEIT